jgi:hypothetical protein
MINTKHISLIALSVVVLGSMSACKVTLTPDENAQVKDLAEKVIENTEVEVSKEGKQDEETQTASIEITGEINRENEDANGNILMFDTLEEYVDTVLNPLTGNQYEVAKPVGFERLGFGGGEALNVVPDGVSASVYILAREDWDVGNIDDIQTFYLDVEGPSPCFMEPVCEEPNTVNYYGPFQGPLMQMVQ